jgi:hypothetical protein
VIYSGWVKLPIPELPLISGSSEQNDDFVLRLASFYNVPKYVVYWFMTGNFKSARLNIKSVQGTDMSTVSPERVEFQCALLSILSNMVKMYADLYRTLAYFVYRSDKVNPTRLAQVLNKPLVTTNLNGDALSSYDSMFLIQREYNKSLPDDAKVNVLDDFRKEMRGK